MWNDSVVTKVRNMNDAPKQSKRDYCFLLCDIERVHIIGRQRQRTPSYESKTRRVLDTCNTL